MPSDPLKKPVDIPPPATILPEWAVQRGARKARTKCFDFSFARFCQSVPFWVAPSTTRSPPLTIRSLFLNCNSPLLNFHVPSPPDCFSTSPIDVTIDGSLYSAATVSFYTPENRGALTILQGSTLLVNNDGPAFLQIFSGGFANPTLLEFTDLQLVRQNFGSPQFNEAVVLNAVLDSGSSSADTPEANTWLLSLVAFLAISLARAFKYRTLTQS